MQDDADSNYHSPAAYVYVGPWALRHRAGAARAAAMMDACTMTRALGGSDEEFWREMARMPDLQALVERAGRRYATSVGEEYDPNPFTRPAHQGGYQHVTPEEWAKWDAANAEFQARRRERLRS
jgi:hypothetical protein